MKLQIVRMALVVVGSVVLISCASGYKSFYKPAQGATPEKVAARRAAPPPASPILERSAPGDPDTILGAYAKRGYVMIGSSMFNSGTDESENSALAQGRAVGADLVLVLNPLYTGSETFDLPITTPTTTTSYTTGSATGYGAREPVTAYGSSTTTTFGSQTNYIPMTVHRQDYGAVYFVKQRFNFGVFVRDLNDGERQELQTNQGVVVRTIVDDSAAFKADILPGDAIMAIDGAPISNVQGFNAIVPGLKGKRVTVTLVRRGQRIEKTVQLDNYY